MTISQNKRRGRRTARRLCKEIGAIYLDPLGGEDGRHSMFSVEAKDRKRFAAAKWLEQAEANCVDPEKIPIVLIHVTNTRTTEDMVLLRLRDFKEIHGEIDG